MTRLGSVHHCRFGQEKRIKKRRKERASAVESSARENGALATRGVMAGATEAFGYHHVLYETTEADVCCESFFITVLIRDSTLCTTS